MNRLLELTTGLIPVHLAARFSPVLTYHACFANRPEDVVEADNITPDRLYDQIATLKRHCRFVPIDEFCLARDRRGIAAITFDDGYKSVIEAALPVLASLEVPSTIFVNTAPLAGSVFWRHKVVYILRHGLAEECARSFVHTRLLGGGFYRDLKNPLNNSRTAEREIDAFLASRGLSLSGCGHLMDDPSYLRPAPRLSYGNHSHNHYVLSSLTPDEQTEEIGRTRALLARAPGIRVSDVFSLPFGETHHMNADTLSLLRDFGYRAVLMTRGGVNARALEKRFGLPLVERFSPVQREIGIQLKKELCKTLLARVA